MPRPSNVAIIACEIPAAISFGSLDPDSVMLWNVMIMPADGADEPQQRTCCHRKLEERLEPFELRHFLEHRLGDA